MLFTANTVNPATSALASEQKFANLRNTRFCIEEFFPEKRWKTTNRIKYFKRNDRSKNVLMDRKPPRKKTNRVSRYVEKVFCRRFVVCISCPLIFWRSEGLGFCRKLIFHFMLVCREVVRTGTY